MRLYHFEAIDIPLLCSIPLTRRRLRHICPLFREYFPRFGRIGKGDNLKYKVYFYYDPEYKGYVADVLDLPGCISQGKTLEEAKENVKDAIAGYLEVEKKKSKGIFSVFIPEESYIGEVTVG
jgi:predicted RNase H-like HicB family nuclease